MTVDDAIAAGRFELAAQFAALLEHPAAYRDAMIRIFNAREASKNNPRGNMTQPYEWVSQVMKLNGINIRREFAGKNAADGRKASDLRLQVQGGSDILDKLSPHLRGSFYEADIEKGGALVPLALTKLIHPLMKQDALEYDLKLAGYVVTVDHAGNPESAITLEGCLINEFRLRLREGGTVAISARVQFHPTPGQLDPLSDKLQQEVIVTIVAPKIVPKVPDLAEQGGGAAAAAT